jgi:hypothetical protein
MAMMGVLPTAWLPAQAPTLVRGVVRGADSLPIPGADVIVSGLSEVRQARTDQQGRYVILLSESAPSVFVTVRRVGYRPEGIRYQVNQLFGTQPAAAGSHRQFPPFQVELGAEYTFSGRPSTPLARMLGVESPKSRLTGDSVQRVIRARFVHDPIAAVL